MALYEYYCDSCQLRFEQITSASDPDAGKCPKCHGKDSKKLISPFAVGGRGDLRESTMHGCHDCHVPTGPGHEAGGHDHGHDGHSHDE
jgi:putative FmdB family regulatory protein